MNIVLDIDGTLIEASVASRKAEAVIYRPFYQEFIDFCFDSPDISGVSIWTAGSKGWVDEVFTEEEQTRFDFVYTGLNCSLERICGGGLWNVDWRTTKPLAKIYKSEKNKLLGYKYTKHNTIIIDDTATTFQQNYGNAVLIRRYKGGETDRELKKLMSFLPTIVEEIKSIGSVRYMEKREWDAL